MKICPKCQTSYADDNLNFCLEDGTVLRAASPQAMPETVLLDQPRPTAPVQGQTGQPAWNTSGQQPYAMQPQKRSSKAWIWVLLILGVLILLCGGGFAGLVYLGSQVDNKNSASSSPAPKTTPGTRTTPGISSSTTSTSDRDDVEKLDLNRWVADTSVYGITEFTDGELLMWSRQARYYYVLAGTEDQKSVNADVSVVVRNVDNKDTNFGYGLVFHSNPTPLQQGYALLVDAKKKRYRIVHHSPGKEEPVVNWTRSDAILDGTQPNKLEIRDKTDKVDIYINDKMVNSIRNIYGFPGGVLGLYAADAIKVAFKDLEIRK